MIGTAQLLNDLLAASQWGLEQDFGYKWSLSDQPDAGPFSLHVLTASFQADATGILFARDHSSRGDEHSRLGVILAGAVPVDRVIALTTALLDHRGAGDLAQLDMLLAQALRPDVAAPAPVS